MRLFDKRRFCDFSGSKLPDGVAIRIKRIRQPAGRLFSDMASLNRSEAGWKDS